MLDEPISEQLRWTLKLRETQGIWAQVALAGTCLLTFYIAANIVRCYRGYFNRGHPGAESPTLFLLPWLAACDAMTATSFLVLLYLPDKSSAAKAFLQGIPRIVAFAQICYLVILILLSMHTLSVAGIISRGVDMAAGEYYGPVAAVLSFALSHRLLVGLSGYDFFFLAVLPLCTLTVLAVATRQISKMWGTSMRVMTMWNDESEEIHVLFCPDSYVRFAKTATGLFTLSHIPWVVSIYAPTQTMWSNEFTAVGICMRSVVSFFLLRTSPAARMRLQDNAEHVHGHAHQD
ncbi:hypothetical protein COEREDRAFT_10769 [Coemansia reversa NRRL 1564]|uniref:Uncharacterized protein n=1 Tax=Coemansia reversa (strain ATCC 12441 / NRRL 1564) TaxID=763665 RepID=A0A2G5B4Q2_COERN|nr:hypothetical protein COEREDRAFT_10769 [Coemansia reversa NRRL 1564]|eukprot:PIA13979.1 hypothetical protein COEREDRAFT_10769 [Coemansia reversa NRRL 1564]